MASVATASTLELRFTKGELSSWVFHYQGDLKGIYTPIGDARSNRLRLADPGVRAFTLFFLRYAASSGSQDPFNLSDKDDPLIASLANQLERPSWIPSVFHRPVATQATAEHILDNIFAPTRGDNRNGHAKAKPRIVRVHNDQLPWTSILVFQDNKLLPKTGIDRLVAALSNRAPTGGSGSSPTSKESDGVAAGVVPENPQTGVTAGAASRSVPKAVMLPTQSAAHAGGVGLQSNFAVRWGLNRQPTRLIIEGESAQCVYDRLLDTELMLARALETAPAVGLLPRLWMWIQRTQDAGIEGSKELADTKVITGAPQHVFADHGAHLGILITVDQSTDMKGALRRSIRDVSTLLEAKKVTNASVVFHVRHKDLARTAAAFASGLFLRSNALPPEIVTILPENSEVAEKQDGRNTFWAPSPSPGQALWRVCQIADPGIGRLRTKEFSILADALRQIRTTMESNADFPHLPLPEDVVADLQRLNLEHDEVITLLIRLLKPYDTLRGMTNAVVRLLASRGNFESRMAALDEAIPDRNLVDAWLDGLPVAERNSMPQWWVNADQRALAAVLAALVRSRRREDHEAAAILRDWIPLLRPRVRAAVELAIQCADHGMQGYWASAAHHATLLFIVDCGLVEEIPFAEIAPEWLGTTEFWRVLQYLPLTPSMLGWLLAAGPGHRATVGLCSATEWTALKESHLLPQVLKRRG